MASQESVTLIRRAQEGDREAWEVICRQYYPQWLARHHGTLGAALGYIIARKISLVIPVGLEKLVYGDINELHMLAAAEDSEGKSLWPITGTIVTEIEALQILTGVEAYLLASGGIAGAEGAVRLLLDGTDEEVEAAVELVDSVAGEPKYLL